MKPTNVKQVGKRVYKQKRKKKWKNPLFKKPDKPISKKLNRIFILLILLVAIYFVIFSPLFFITKIKFDGDDAYDTKIIENTIQDQLNNKLLFIIPEKNLLFYSKEQLINSFKDHPYIKTIEIKKAPLHTLKVNYSLRQSNILIFNQNLFWTADNDGFIISILDNIDDYNGPKVYDKFNSYKVTDRVNYYQKINTYIKVWENIQSKYKSLDIQPTQINLSQNNSIIDLLVNEGWKITFNIDNDIERQLTVLEQIIKEKIEERDELKYIDLRIEDWVYYN